MLKQAIFGGMAAAVAAALASPAASTGWPAATSARLLAAHNSERARVGVAPLTWDPFLAASAASYGPQLERLGHLRHSPRTGRPGQRENLWMGPRGSFAPEEMVSSWIAEKRHFRPGVFPHVSRTGNWMDVSHYSQMVWRGTTHVGCAIHRGVRWDFLICRYSPPGNQDGKPVY
jgi:hypothetical protein